MFVKKLDIVNFRNYKKQSVHLNSGLNVFLGNNAQGKTNLMEAVSICSVGRSPRTPRDKELIYWGENRASVVIEFNKIGGNERIEIIIDKSENKRIAINKLPITRIGELMGVLPSVFFSPTEIKIIQSSPSERRSFMDIALCQLSRAYFYTLSRYNKILSQRNRLLKSGKATQDALSVWDMQLAECGAKIIKSRKGFLARLSVHANSVHEYLTDGKETLTLSYEGLGGGSTEETQELFLKALLLQHERDLSLGHTNTGPQKDDIEIKINGIDVRTYGSQGQQRTAALSLKLAELELARAETGESPVLLLDDVLSELDKTRQIKLLERIRGYQTILTCTHTENDVFCDKGQYKQFKVENGKISE